MTAEERVIHIQVDQHAARLDRLLVSKLPDMSRSQVQKLIRQGKVLLSGQPARPNTSVTPGLVITLHLPPPPAKTAQPEPIPLDILSENDTFIVLNKVAGMVVHPAHGHPGGTLVNGLLARYPDLAALSQADPDSAQRPGIVHRLDKDTSGVMVVARTLEAVHHLRRQFKARTVQKIYLALVFGTLPAPAGLIDVPLGRDLRQPQKFAPRADGKSARTHYHLRQKIDPYSLLELGLETGRTHQIRVHLAWLKCPVVGDTVYGFKKNKIGLKRQFLHAWRLGFDHPGSGKRLEFEAPMDAHLQTVLDGLQ